MYRLKCPRRREGRVGRDWLDILGAVEYCRSPGARLKGDLVYAGCLASERRLFIGVEARDSGRRGRLI